MKTVEVDAAVRYNIVIDKGILPKKRQYDKRGHFRRKGGCDNRRYRR